MYLSHGRWTQKRHLSSHCDAMGLAASAAPGCRFAPKPSRGLKDSALTQLQCRLQLWLGSDPWPGTSVCHREARKEKTEPLTLLCANLSSDAGGWGALAGLFWGLLVVFLEALPTVCFCSQLLN